MIARDGWGRGRSQPCLGGFSGRGQPCPYRPHSGDPLCYFLRGLAAAEDRGEQEISRRQEHVFVERKRFGQPGCALLGEGQFATYADGVWIELTSVWQKLLAYSRAYAVSAHEHVAAG